MFEKLPTVASCFLYMQIPVELIPLLQPCDFEKMAFSPHQCRVE